MLKDQQPKRNTRKPEDKATYNNSVILEWFILKKALVPQQVPSRTTSKNEKWPQQTYNIWLPGGTFATLRDLIKQIYWSTFPFVSHQIKW